jgi:mannose-1-phosphate guanylyltransferase
MPRPTPQARRRALRPGRPITSTPRAIIYDARTKARRTPICIVGLRDSILVQTDDATLVAHKSQSQKIKDLVRKLAAEPRYAALV